MTTQEELLEKPVATSAVDTTGQYSRRQLIVFKQGQEEYGLTIDQIKEVVLTPNITRMPQTPSYVKGVANIRGNIIAIIDLEEKFGLRSSTDNASVERGNYTLVVASEEYKLGILVREVPNTLTVLQADIDETVNIVQEGTSEGHYVKGIVKIKERLIILIDIFRIVRGPEMHQILKK